MTRLPSEMPPYRPNQRFRAWTMSFADLVRSGVVVLLWSVIALAALAAATVSLTAIWWAFRLCLKALGAGGH